ncbi:LysR family transcriptional regulator [Burkholderia stagnalis]|uniref:LysR family transcriptional regulator n=1 Tax=Burkholderia stagnalis TaxID=1503054 RepID=A0A6L3N3N6_9BURK|nr:LysR substrate-binding domain-containing protein [Burkholderia stagnalis]KAB0639957.1 LysR family transcriptional regulator [Burkholderia stagnalis]KVL87840.1 LysR family transcriptional regulator [Burkholderia stagnalis]KVM03523.1 LysR family transcriptional regulator [Burkholderia stagnalis]KVO44368.1 LysR family transcriptional regulator [Burkholderia stagnalis]KVO82006.1 LysR family transcriptional regulator [Burkholderia stagnalis]
MTLTQLRVFAAIIEHGSLRGAARALKVTQSNVTQQLQNLELALGVPLVERTNRGIVLTKYGERLLARASAILGECDRADSEMRQLRGDFGGSVVLGMTTEPMIQTLAPVLEQYCTRFPQVSVHLLNGTSRKMISWLRDGALDFAVALVGPATDTHDLAVTPLYRSDPVVVCRRGHPLQHATTLAELADCKWIATRQPGSSTAPPVNRLTTLFAEHGLAPPNIVVTTEALFDTLHLVSETDWLSLEPSIVTRYRLFGGELESIAIAERAAESSVSVLQRASVPLTPVAQELATMIVSYARMTHA